LVSWGPSRQDQNQNQKWFNKDATNMRSGGEGKGGMWQEIGEEGGKGNSAMVFGR